LPLEPDALEPSTSLKGSITESSTKTTDPSSGLSFSSKKVKDGTRTAGLKRKAPNGSGKADEMKQNPKKPKKSKKGLLSFDREDMG
jgi:hypothetical protein